MKTELPMLNIKDDTLYRYLKSLIEKWLISKIPKIDYFKLTDTGKFYDMIEEWIGKKSESEKNPTYNNTINNINSNNNDNTNIFNNINIIKETSGLEQEREKEELNPTAFWNTEVWTLIEYTKETFKKFWITYCWWKNERNRAKNMLGAKRTKICEENWYESILDLVHDVIEKYSALKYTKPICSIENIFYSWWYVLEMTKKQTMQSAQTDIPKNENNFKINAEFSESVTQAISKYVQSRWKRFSQEWLDLLIENIKQWKYPDQIIIAAINKAIIKWYSEIYKPSIQDLIDVFGDPVKSHEKHRMEMDDLAWDDRDMRIKMIEERKALVWEDYYAHAKKAHIDYMNSF